MDIDRQADFLHAAFDAWWQLECAPALGIGRDPSARAVALTAFAAGILATDSLLARMREEQAAEAE